MPAYKWSIQPVYMCRKPLPPDKRDVYEFEALANATLSLAIKQLAHLASASSDLFDELGAECAQLCERTRVLKTRIITVQQVVVKLDAKKVAIRKWRDWFCTVAQHHVDSLAHLKHYLSVLVHLRLQSSIRLIVFHSTFVAQAMKCTI